MQGLGVRAIARQLKMRVCSPRLIEAANIRRARCRLTPAWARAACNCGEIWFFNRIGIRRAR